MKGESLPKLYQTADPIAPSYQNRPKKYWTLCSPEPSLKHEREAESLCSESQNMTRFRSPPADWGRQLSQPSVTGLMRSAPARGLRGEEIPRNIAEFRAQNKYDPRDANRSG
jgi:hypothetical protein